MSAYLLTPEHFAALAAFAARNDSVVHDWRGADMFSSAINAACNLAKANIASVNARYSEQRTDADCIVISQAGELAAKYVAHPLGLAPVVLFKMVQCFNYQACEVKNYETSLAARQMDWINSAIIRTLPGYDAAPWGFVS